VIENCKVYDQSLDSTDLTSNCSTCDDSFHIVSDSGF